MPRSPDAQMPICPEGQMPRFPEAQMNVHQCMTTLYKTAYDTSIIDKIIDENLNLKEFLMKIPEDVGNFVEEGLVGDYDLEFTFGCLNLVYEGYFVNVIVFYDCAPVLPVNWRMVCKQILLGCRI